MGTQHTLYIGDSREIGWYKTTCHLVVTSPPYWDIKDYGHKDQIGFGQSYKEYIASLEKVFRNCYKSLVDGGRACINIGDIYVSKELSTKGFCVIPVHATVIMSCIRAGFIYTGSILWIKATNQNSSGGGSWMGSTYYPRDGVVTQNNEYILLFKKPGVCNPPSEDLKIESQLSYEERSKWFTNKWEIPGKSLKDHPAPFPLEIPHRLIKMFSFKGETVYDPFMGSGTTMRAAALLGRDSVGCELNREYVKFVKDNIKGTKGRLRIIGKAS